MTRLFAALSLLLSLFAAPAVADEAETEAAMRELGDRFARGFFRRDAGQVLSTVHPALSKLGVDPNYRGSGRASLEHLPPGHLEILGDVYNADGRLHPTDSPVEIEMLDAEDGVGLMRLAAGREWYDYFLGVRVDGEWTLLNCAYGPYTVFDNPEEAADRAAIAETVERYAGGLDGQGFSALRSAVHTDVTRRTLSEAGDEVALQSLEGMRARAEAHEGRASEAEITVFTPTRLTGAARIDAGDRTEWVLLQRLNGEWLVVNAFWTPTA